MNEVDEATRITKVFYESNALAYAANTEAMSDKTWLDKFVSYLMPGARILDVGCAGGRDTQWFLEHGFLADGIDIAPTFLAMARTRVPEASFREMSVEELDYADATFDGVWCSCVLIHLPKAGARRAVTEMLRVLKPGGILYLLVKEGAGEGPEADPRYGGALKYSSYFSEDEIRAMLQAAEIITLTAVDRPVDNYRAPDRIFVVARRS